MAHTNRFDHWLEYDSSTLTRLRISLTDSKISSLATTPTPTLFTLLPDSSSPTHSDAAHKTISSLPTGNVRLLIPRSKWWYLPYWGTGPKVSNRGYTPVNIIIYHRPIPNNRRCTPPTPQMYKKDKYYKIRTWDTGYLLTTSRRNSEPIT